MLLEIINNNSLMLEDCKKTERTAYMYTRCFGKCRYASLNNFLWFKIIISSLQDIAENLTGF